MAIEDHRDDADDGIERSGAASIAASAVKMTSVMTRGFISWMKSTDAWLGCQIDLTNFALDAHCPCIARINCFHFIIARAADRIEFGRRSRLLVCPISDDR